MDCCKKIRYSAHKTLLLQSLFKGAKVSKVDLVLRTVGLSALYLTKESDITAFFARKRPDVLLEGHLDAGDTKKDPGKTIRD